MTSMIMTNATHPSNSPLSSSSTGLSVPELLLLTEALVQLAQQSQQTQQVSLADVDWTSIATMLASRYPLGSSSSLTPNLLSSELLTHLSTLSSPSSPSSIPLAALITLSTSLKQQRLQQLKDEYTTSTARQQQLEQQLTSASSASSSLPVARVELPVPPMFPSAAGGVGYVSTPLLMSPLQRSVSEKSRLPSTPLPPTAASIAHMPPLEESTMSEPADTAAVIIQPPVNEETATAAVKREAGINVQVTPPPPLMRTITDMELDRPYETEAAVDDGDVTATKLQPVETDTESIQPIDTTDTSQSSITPPATSSSSSSSSPTSRTSSATLTATCLEILTCLQRHPDADPFRYPVDPTEVPNYYDTIRHPMDFDTIRTQLTSLPPLVTSPQQFHERLLLVFSNAYTFNDKKTSFYKMAKNLDAFAAELCRKYWPEEKKSFFASPEARKLTGRQSGRVGGLGSGVKEVELETPVGVMVVGVVSAPSSPSNDKESGSGSGSGSGGSGGGAEDEVGGVVVGEAEVTGRKSGRGGRGGGSSVASTPTGAAGERMGTRKAVKGSKAEEEVAVTTEADDGKAGGRKKGETVGRGRGGTRRKSERGETEETEEKVQEEVKAQETPKSRRGRGRGRGHPH